MLSFSRYLAMLALLLMAALPANAQTAPAPQSAVPLITTFDDAIISRLLLEGQATWKIDGGPDGRPVYRVSAGNGINFSIQQQACAPQQGCRGLLLIATFASTDKRSLAQLDNFLNRFNDVTSTAKVYRTADGTVLLQGYVNAAFGISFANAQAQLLVFGRNYQALRTQLAAFSGTS